MQHAYLPPSGASAWSVCPAWPAMNVMYPQPDTEDSINGEGAHAVIELIEAGKRPSEGQLLENGAVVTQEMLEGAELFMETVQSLAGKATIKFHETRVQTSINEHCWGTPDFYSYDAQAGIVDVIDYKFGHGFVDEYENKQGIAYMDGVMEWLAAQLGKPRGLIDEHLNFRFTIVQPRCYYKGSPVRTWSLKGSDLRGYVNKLSYAAAVALDRAHHEHKAVTNDECKHCPGRHACQALQQSAYASAELAGSANPVELSPAAASLELKMLENASKKLEARIEGLKQVVLMQLQSGKRSQYYQIDHPQGHPRWVLPDDQVLALGDLYGVDLGKRTVITPKQAVKLGVSPDVMKQLSKSSSGAAKLVPVDDSAARKVFSPGA